MNFDHLSETLIDMKLYPVYPRLLDQLLFIKNLYREDEYGFDAVSSNAGSISGEGKNDYSKI